MTGGWPPHSRWLLRESMDRLAASHAAAVNAVAALAHSAARHDSARGRPAALRRATGRVGWPRAIWLGATTLLTALFMAWISVRLTRHLAGAPGAIAVLPGLLLTLALAGTAVQAATSPERTPESVLPRTLFAVAAACSVALITLSLVTTTGTPAWEALICAAAVVAAVAAGMLASARSLTESPAADARDRPSGALPRRLRLQRRRAQRRLRDHTRSWNLAAHQYSVAIVGSEEAARALTRLLAEDADPPLKGIDPFDVLILTSLSRYRPAPLMADLETAVRRMSEARPQGATIEIMHA